MPQAPSTRWCPTPEQLMVLEDMYRSGLKTPNASQIQQITTYLSYYGKIEGKNVFYWFQNHKARDRQKLRRRLSRHHQLLLNHNPHSTNQQLFHSFEEPSLNYLQQGEDQAMNLLSKLEAEGKDDGVIGTDGVVTSGIGYDVHQCCRPLITLDLFPSKSTTGLRDQYCSSSSKNSSCSTSTNL